MPAFPFDTLDPDRPVLIAGPTASGKSAMALEIAARQGGVVVNADALQVYECWRVLSARPTPEDEAAAPHALYGHVPFEVAYSVGDWLREVAPILDGGLRPIVVGGTGLYFSALTEGLAEIPPIPPAIRAEGDRLRQQDPARMLADLDAEDPETAQALDRQIPMRVQRAWEVLRATGRGFKRWHAETPAPLLPLDRAQAFVLMPDTAWLNARIETRFDAMLAMGALDEVRALAPRWDPSLPAAQAIGAAELIAHLSGELDLGESRDRAVTATRQFAKRQRTWFRNRLKSWDVVDPSP